MRRCILTVLLCLFTVAANAQDKPADITLLNGKILKNARVSRVDPDGLRIVHDDGLTKVPMEDLPPALKEKYSFDSQKADQFREKQQQAMKQAAAEEKQRLDEEKADKERKADLTRKEQEKARNTPRLTTAEGIKGWLRSLPQPEGLTDHQNTAKVKFAESMSKMINSGQLDLEAEKTALQWNQSEYQRVGQNENANALNSQIAAVQTSIDKREERKQQAEIAQQQAQLQAANIASMQQLTRSLNDVAFQMMNGVKVHW